MHRSLIRSILYCGVNAALAIGLVASVLAQPALDRLEQEFKPQNPVQAGSAPAANEPGYLGVVAEPRKEQGPGIRVLKANSGTPAAQADIQAGDLLIAIDDQPIMSLDDLEAALKSRKAGDRVQFTIERNKTAELRDVVLGRLPARRLPGEPTPAAIAPQAVTELERPRRLGIRTVAITDDIRLLYDLQSTKGALVSEVIVGSPAHAAGIPLDAVIVEANGQAVTSPDTLAKLVVATPAGQELALAYYSRGQLQRKSLRLEGSEIAAKPVAPVIAPAPDPVRDFTARLEILEARIRQLEKQLQEVQSRVAPPAKSSETPAPK